MKLKDFLEALTTSNVQVTLCELDSGAEIATIKVEGFASLDDTIESRKVMQWSMQSGTAIKVILGEVLTDSTNTDPVDPDPSNP